MYGFILSVFLVIDLGEIKFEEDAVLADGVQPLQSGQELAEE